MHTWALITFVAFAASASYLLALGADWRLEKRYRKVLFLMRRKERFERHASQLPEWMLTCQCLEDILLVHAEYKRQQQAVFLPAFPSNSDGSLQAHMPSACIDAQEVIHRLTLAGRYKTHATFQAVCRQFSPLCGQWTYIPLVLIAYLGIELLQSFHIT